VVSHAVRQGRARPAGPGAIAAPAPARPKVHQIPGLVLRFAHAPSTWLPDVVYGDGSLRL
jgi:hypothetical protein